MPKERERKTIFQHASDLLGSKEKKKGKVTLGKPLIDLDNLKKTVISFVVYMALGWLIGTIIDMIIKTNYAGIALACAFIIFWILKKFKDYL